MKTFAVDFVALLAVVSAKTIADNIHSVGVEIGFEDGASFHVDEKIIGGTNTTIELYPYQISLRLNDRFICGGSIISATRALTARHCTSESNPLYFSILAGSTTHTGDANVQIRILSRILAHPLGAFAIFDHDISIVYWTQPLIFGDTVRPIALPAANATVPYGQNATPSGWGKTSQSIGSYSLSLQSINLTLVSSEHCNRSHSGRITPDMVCAGGEAGQGACHGDSGGPLVHSSLLIGIVSWSRPCALEDYPTVFVRVAYFIDWIRENAN